VTTFQHDIFLFFLPKETALY